MLYGIHVVLSAVLLGTRAAFATATASSLLLLTLVVTEKSGLLPVRAEVLRRLFPPAASGELLILLMTYVSLLFAMAYLTGLFSRTVRDQAERNADLARRLGLEQARLQSTVEQMAEGVMLVDETGRPLLVNAAMKRLWNTSFDDEKGIVQCHPPEKQAIVQEILRSVCSGDSPRYHRRTQKKGHFLETTLTQIRSEEGAVHGLVLVTRDVTEQHRMQEQMIRQEKLSVLGRLASTVAHELNNPLTAVAMFADLIVKHPSSGPETRGHADTILQNIVSCKRIVQDLLGYTSPAPPQLETMDLAEALREAISLLRPLVKKQRIELTLPNGTVPLLVTGDRGQLRQAFTNLLMNAIRAVEHAPERRVTVGLELRGRMAGVCVRDSGPGVPPEHRDRLFEPFFTTRLDGTGLGLAIVRGIAERHKGKVWFESPPGEGAAFFLELPLYESSVAR